jgi:hypothetical protein
MNRILNNRFQWLCFWSCHYWVPLPFNCKRLQVIHGHFACFMLIPRDPSMLTFLFLNIIMLTLTTWNIQGFNTSTHIEAKKPGRQPRSGQPSNSLLLHCDRYNQQCGCIHHSLLRRLFASFLLLSLPTRRPVPELLNPRHQFYSIVLSFYKHKSLLLYLHSSLFVP